jgi:hypothetical protein
MSARDVSVVEPAAADWSGWERWLQHRLDHEIQTLHAAIGRILAGERRKFEAKIREIENALAKIIVLPPAPARFPSVKVWTEGVHYKGDVVVCGGSTYQALRDTGQPPGSADWVCLATAGEGFTIRGTYDVNAAYKRGDIVMMDGASFVALRDQPGACPGTGWRLLAMRGARGRQGPSGQRGLMGLRGERGEAAPGIQSWSVDRSRYTATPIMSDGSIGPTLSLRGLFEQFLAETSDGR